MNWHDIVPPAVAIQQISWERALLIMRARKIGLTYRQISQYIGISAGRASQIVRSIEWRREQNAKYPKRRYDKYEIAPVERYFAETCDLERLQDYGKRALHKQRRLQRQVANAEKQLAIWHKKMRVLQLRLEEDIDADHHDC